jgi:hypothetical protein
MPSLSELGKQVKAKYPGQYDDVPDQELGVRVQEKFPGAYDDFKDETAQEKPAKKKDNFLGIGNFAKGLAQSAFQLSADKKKADQSLAGLNSSNDELVRRALKLPANDPRREKYLKLAQQNAALASGVQEERAADIPSNREFLTSAANTALTIAGAGSFGAKAVSGAPVSTFRLAGRLAQEPLKKAVGQSGLLSGLLGASERYGQGGSVTDSLKAGAVSGAIGAGTTGLVGGLAKLFRKSTSDVPEAIYRSSTRLPNDSKAGTLLKEGVVGGRKALREKAGKLIADAEAKIAASPDAAKNISIDDVLNYDGIKQLREQARRVGELDRVDEIIRKSITGLRSSTVAEKVPKSLENLEDLIGELTEKAGRGDVTAKKALAKLSEKFVNETDQFTVLEGLKQKRAIDAMTPPSAFADTATQYEARTKNAVADAIRRALSDKSGTVRRQLEREQPAVQLIGELDRYSRAKSNQIPGSIGGVLSRTLLTPAFGTRLARAGYLAGAPARRLDATVLNPQVRQALRAFILAGGNAAAFNQD